MHLINVTTGVERWSLLPGRFIAWVKANYFLFLQPWLLKVLIFLLCPVFSLAWGQAMASPELFFLFWRRGSMMIDTLEILSPWMMQSSNWRLKIPKTNKKHPLLCNGLPIICSNPFTLTKYFLKTIMSASVPTIPFIIIHTNFIWIFFQIKWGDRAPKLAHSDQKPSLKFPIFYISMVDVQKKDLPVIIFSKGSMTSNDGNKLSNRNIVLNRKWGACSLAPPENSGTSSSPYNQLLLRSENLNL